MDIALVTQSASGKAEFGHTCKQDSCTCACTDASSTDVRDAHQQLLAQVPHERAVAAAVLSLCICANSLLPAGRVSQLLVGVVRHGHGVNLSWRGVGIHGKARSNQAAADCNRLHLE